MTDSDHTTQAKFRRDAVSIMTSSSKVVSMRLDKTETTVARAVGAIEQQTRNLAMLTANVERLERSVTGLSRNAAMIEDGRSQRETVNNLIKLAAALGNQRAS